MPRVSALTEFIAPTFDDILIMVDAPGSTPLLRIITLLNFIKTLGWYDANAYSSINAAVTAIGSTEAVLVVHSAQTLTAASLTIPSNISLVILKGGSIVKASTYTLTINGPFEAGLYQVFSGFDAGDVTFGTGSKKEAYPEWWGIDGTADEVEINKALVAVGNYGTVKLIAKSYTTAAEIVLSSTTADVLKTNLISNVGSLITSTSTGNILRIGNDGGTYGVQRSEIGGFSLQSDTAIIGIYVTGGGAGRNKFKDIYVQGKTAPLTNSMGILLWGALLGNFYNTFENVEVAYWDKNISMGYNWNTAATTSTPANATRFHQMKIHDWKTYGFYNKNTVETYLQGNFEHAITGALADIYLAAVGSDGIYNTINDSGIGNAYILEDLCDGNVIQVYHKPADTPIVDNNTVERNTWIFNGGVAKLDDLYVHSFRKASGYALTMQDTLNFADTAAINVGKTIIPPGTTGNQTINKLAGRVNIAIGGTSVVVTNSFVTVNSIVLAVANDNDTTAYVKGVVVAAGSFTIRTPAVTAETAFNFFVIN